MQAVNGSGDSTTWAYDSKSLLLTSLDLEHLENIPVYVYDAFPRVLTREGRTTPNGVSDRGKKKVEKELVFISLCLSMQCNQLPQVSTVKTSSRFHRLPCYDGTVLSNKPFLQAVFITESTSTLNRHL